MTDKEHADIHNLKEIHEDVPPDFYDTSLKTNPFQRFWHGNRFREMSRLATPVRGMMLDIGCDGCTLTQEVARASQAKRVVGIDISDHAVAYGMEKRPSFDLLVGDAEELPFRDGMFDAIFASEVMEHIHHPEKIMAEIRRCLAAEGYAVVMVPIETRLFKFIWFFWTRFGKGKVWQHAHVQEFSGESLGRVVREAGFEVVEDRQFLLGMLRAMKVRRPGTTQPTPRA